MTTKELRKIDTNVLEQAILKWGVELQTMVAIEEMAELTQALSKCKRKTDYDTLEHVTEEIADVYIMLQQLTMMYSNSERVKEVITRKIDRLRGIVGDTP